MGETARAGLLCDPGRIAWAWGTPFSWNTSGLNKNWDWKQKENNSAVLIPATAAIEAFFPAGSRGEPSGFEGTPARSHTLIF
jgi:hypothetical protein